MLIAVLNPAILKVVYISDRSQVAISDGSYVRSAGPKKNHLDEENNSQTASVPPQGCPLARLKSSGKDMSKKNWHPHVPKKSRKIKRGLRTKTCRTSIYQASQPRSPGPRPRLPELVPSEKTGPHILRYYMTRVPNIFGAWRAGHSSTI